MEKIEGNHCVICGKPIPIYNFYCSNIRCQQQYERKLNIVHNSKAYKFYMMFYYIREEECLFRGDIERT